MLFIFSCGALLLDRLKLSSWPVGVRIVTVHMRTPSGPVHAPRFVIDEHQPAFLDSRCSRLNFSVYCLAPDNTQRSLFAAESSRRSSQLCTMWNDEDNNPYGTSFERRDSSASSTANNLPRKFRNLKATCTPALQDDALHLLV